MNWKSTIVVSGAGLIATWMGMSSPNSTRDGAISAPARQAATPAFTPSSDIVEQAARLQYGVRAHTEFRTPTRNPFRFAAERPVRIAAPPAQVVEPPPTPAQPEQPALRLVGITSDTIDGALQRTAVLRTRSDVQVVKEGESVGGYTVTKIDDSSVELAGPDAAPLTLTFRP